MPSDLDLGLLTNLLGLEIERNCNQRTLHVSQKRYIEQILVQHGLECSNPALTPADRHEWLEKSYPEFEVLPESKRKYQSAVGYLMYAMLGSCPNIAYAVGKVSQYSANPDITHFPQSKEFSGTLLVAEIAASAIEHIDLGTASPMLIREVVTTEGQLGLHVTLKWRSNLLE